METCERCGGKFDIEEGEKRPGVNCSLCDEEYWKARYGTIGPLAYPFNIKRMNAVEERWKAMTEQRLGHAMPAKEEHA